MALKDRIGLVVLAGLLTLCGIFGVATWMRDGRQQARYDALLMQAQTIAWERAQTEALAQADAAAKRLAADPALRAAVQGRDREAAGMRLDMEAQAKGMRVDVLDARGALVATTATGLDPAPLGRSGWFAAAAEATGKDTADAAEGADRADALRGLSQIDAMRYAWVAIRGFPGGAVAVGIAVEGRLAPLAASLGGDVALVNMRGHEVAATRAGLLQQHGIVVPVRSRTAFVQRDGDGDLQVVSLPLPNLDGRETAVLVWLRDAADSVRAERRADIALTTGLAFFAVLLAAGLLLWLRHVTEPLGRAVGVLQSLAAGKTDAALDEGEDEAEGEAGDMARGIGAIRAELLNLQTLRDERIRTRRQQERLIRDQLRTLADSLEPGSREEIIAALGEAQGGADAANGTGTATDAGNQLADLASILGRMSGLVTDQQNQLLKLLRDLQAAMETQAMFASLQQELEIARQMQLSILPRLRPDAASVDVRATMIPAKEVGGDFYDYFMVDDEHLAVVVADVSGKGVPAAFFMAISRTLLKSNALFMRTPGATIAALNEQLCADNDQMMFVTVFLGVLHLPSGGFSYVNAGHNPPLRLHGGQVEYFPRGQNMALAVLEGQDFTEGNTVLAPGETLLLYTDGVTEATNREGVLMGEQALRSLLAEAHAAGADLPQAVVRAVHAFENGAAQSDDITVVSLTYRGLN
ncbi:MULTISPECIES: PP2C family protein-serine/threonine phosphatase [unclassified Variovorax]|uniref:PP2C family protein-serine/threonine phosphatase n=1 Tax=unclassified Variovorax TaxID=663243 RepID=UPI0008D24157|nr:MULTISPECIES: PP2C family protein-serine/threonine phosphatase [unclassified Variovorax]SEK10221.1 sigma-B regulation protein RsbU (phosphoserine phosphatase) [Variovorax sp. OK202]SFD66931.1 sigma-B regulation protein RsbU (phosphoserine phosphatase) [Variovorax sp. OK212]